MKYTNEQIEALLEGIYNGTVTEFDLPEDLYLAIANYLKSGLYKGFEMTLEMAEGKDLELLAQLRENVYMFSAAKTYQEIKDISGMLVDEEGNIRTQREFNRLGREAYNNWNQNWGETEYNTAILQGQNSVKWLEIEKNKDLFPNLRYSTIGDACAICAPLNDMVAPVDDPIWDILGPENHFNCECVLLQEDADTPVTENYEEIANASIDKMSDTFKNNAGKSGMVFTKDHPYFADASKELGKENFNLPIPETDE